jgi:hypothetical protein
MPDISVEYVLAVAVRSGVGDVFYPEGVRNERLVAYGDFRSPPNMARIVWSTIGSTLTGGVYYVFRAWRYHEV